MPEHIYFPSHTKAPRDRRLKFQEPKQDPWYSNEAAPCTPMYVECCWPMCRNVVVGSQEIPMCDGHMTRVFEAVLAREHQKVIALDLVWNPNKLKTPKERFPDHETGYVYYLEVDGLIKIGYTKDVERRLKQYPPSSELLTARIGTKITERAEHNMFASSLARGREWFHPTLDLMKHIGKLQAEHGGPYTARPALEVGEHTQQRERRPIKARDSRS